MRGFFDELEKIGMSKNVAKQLARIADLPSAVGKNISPIKLKAVKSRVAARELGQQASTELATAKKLGLPAQVAGQAEGQLPKIYAGDPAHISYGPRQQLAASAESAQWGREARNFSRPAMEGKVRTYRNLQPRQPGYFGAPMSSPNLDSNAVRDAAYGAHG